MENNTSTPTLELQQKEVHEISMASNAEPYVGMPIDLDDEFFQFVSEDIELDCMLEDDMKPGTGTTKPDSGITKPDAGTQKPKDCVKGCPLAMAYVPWQMWEETYEPEKGFSVGTIFPSLDLPFLGGAGK